jgi:hypothetical protein
MLMTVEEHGGDYQLVRLRSWPQAAKGPVILICSCIVGCIFAGALDWLMLAIVLGVLATLISIRTVRDCAIATAAYLDVLAEGATCVYDSGAAPSSPPLPVIAPAKDDDTPPEISTDVSAESQPA